jgi:uncharacterized protein
MPPGVVPFRQFVLKVCTRCDLACDHCYVYEHADQSWRAKPKVISDETVVAAASRIASHARSHAVPEVRVILHGGEPLLAGKRRLGRICARLREVIEPACGLDLRIHTNGVLLDEEFCEIFAEHGVKIGISLDGDRVGNDLHRRYADGRSSYDQVVAAIALLRTPRYGDLFAGLLCTIDVRNDPLITYDALAALRPPRIDMLLPHSTWDMPPPAAAPGRTPYADWLIKVYQRWAADPDRVPVRLLESVLATIRGGRSTTEALGLAASDLMVIETDGAIEQVDSIKIAYDGAPETGLDVHSSDLDEAARHPAITARQQGLAGLCATCRDCPVVISCGGGLYAHRYRDGNGFDNPSVFCADLKKLIMHIRSSPSLAVAGQKKHKLPGRDFVALAAGFGGQQAIDALAAAHLSKTRALLGQVRDLTAGTVQADAAWEVLFALDPATLDELLAYPYVRAWATRCVREPAAHAGHLAAIAIAGAIRARLPAELTVQVRDGHVHIPTFGRLRVRGGAGTATVSAGSGWFTVRVDGDAEHRVELDAMRHESAWQPVRSLCAAGTVVILEDTDLYRDCHQWPAAPRLTTAEADRWQHSYDAAWDLIARDYAGYAPGLATGLTTIMPMVGGAAGHEVSAAARQAFGAVGAALPAAADTLALLLLHEFQHVKLGALLDLFQLCDPNDSRLFYAPWRDDPRPAEALLQGIYAHVAVTDFWRVRRHRLDGDQARAAAARFAMWRAQTTEAAHTLAGSGALTSLGARFVDGLLATLHEWQQEPVPHAAAELAKRRADQHRAANGVPG